MTHALPPVSASATFSKPARAAIPLRLVAFRGGLGIELYEAQALGPLSVEELTWSLPGVGFPVDLSGGVRSFRRKRGLLQRVVLSLRLVELEQWLTRRGENAPSLGTLQRPVAVWPLEHGIGVGICAQHATLGFDLLWAPNEEEAQFIVSNPRRASDLATPPLSYVLAFLSHVVGPLAECNGRRLAFGAVAQLVARELLPKLGFRLPQTRGLRCSSLEFRSDCLMITIDRGLPPWAAPPAVAGAMEFARTALSGDVALTSGNLDAARQAYVVALESAPRHPELSQVIASIDSQFEERAEAALGLLVESLPAVEFGLVGAQLLAKTGDIDGARLAIAKLSTIERFAPLSAAYWLALSGWLPELEAQLEAIELAIAASSGFVPARWARLSARVHLGDVNGAVADAEHLEAASVGSEARHAALIQAASKLAEAGYVEAAGRLYERSLRYIPTDPRSSLGVALSLAKAGKQDRALVLLHRTLELAQDNDVVRSEANMALARLLADHVGDLPAAINRARQVTGVSSAAVEARGYEAKWRARIGDLAGAAVAFSRLADTVNASNTALPFRAAHWLLEAGKFFSERSNDDRTAERLLGQALRLLPKDAAVAEAYRAVAERVQTFQKRTLQSQEVQSAATAPGRGPGVILAHEKLAANEQPEAGHADEMSDEDAERNLELEVESLKAQLLASRAPQAEVIDALVHGLHRLGRDEEAYALLQARVDDATGVTKATLQQALRRVLQALIDAARDAGEADDVELYELAMNRLDV